MVLDLYERGMVEMPTRPPKASVHNEGSGQDQYLIESPSSFAYFEQRWNGSAPTWLATLRINPDISAAKGEAVSADKLSAQAHHY